MAYDELESTAKCLALQDIGVILTLRQKIGN